MTPQEQRLVSELFDRLAKLEGAPRDAEAERLIADGSKRAPHALYALVQTALVQDEALKRANARIQDLQSQIETDQQPQQRASFLDSMRDAVFGREAARGSVPSVQPRAAPGSGGAFAPQPQADYPPPRPAAGFPSYPAASPFGGSFLGTAASAAAGVIGGGLLLDGIRSMFGHRAGFANDPYAFAIPAEPVAVAPEHPSVPWHGDAADSDLARQAGIDDIERGGTDPRSDDANLADMSDMTEQEADAPEQEDAIADNEFDDTGSFGNDDSYDV
jgi:hypothetical protein